MSSAQSAEEERFDLGKQGTLVVDAKHPAIVHVRQYESLVILRCSGSGRLLASVSEASSNRLVVEDAVCFDSLDDDTVEINHTVIKDATTAAVVEFHVEKPNDAFSIVVQQNLRFSLSERGR